MLFILSLLSIYIPFEATESPTTFPFTEYDFRVFCTKTPTVIALIVSDQKSSENKKAIERFSNAIVEFSDHTYFLVLNSSQVPQLNSRFEYKKPYIVLINRAQISLNCEIPEDDLSLATTLHFWTTSLRYTATSSLELYELLGPTKYALILREVDINEGFRILTNFINVYGTTEIIAATDEVFEQINMENDKFLLFRRDDNCIIPVTFDFNTTKNDDNSTNTTNYNYTALLQKAREYGTPDYSRLEDQDLDYQNYTFLGLIYNTDNEFKSTSSINTINTDISATLENLHNIAPEYKVVLIEQESFNIVESVTHKKIQKVPDLLVFNYKSRFYYPNGGFFDDIPIGSEQLQISAYEYIKKIRNGEIKSVYFSENENDIGHINSKSIKTIVGSNFQDFVDDPENDVMIIFRTKKDQSQVTTETSSSFGLTDQDFIQISEEIQKASENANVNLKIGIIDPTNNSSPKQFPFYLHLPHIELYLRGKKDQSKPMYGRIERNSILRFLKVNNIDLGLPVSNLTFNEALWEMESIVRDFPKLEGRYKIDAESYVTKVLQPIVEIEPFNSPFGMTPEEIVEMKKNARNSKWYDSIDNLETFTINSEDKSDK